MKPPRFLTEQEQALWLQAMHPAQMPPPEEPQAQSVPDESEKRQLAPPAAGPHALDARQRRQIEKGRIPIESMLDLHGCTQHQAFTLLIRFLETAQGQGRKLVLVVTGKGRDTPGVLRTMLPQWLESPPLRPHVMAYGKAAAHHGGAGAYYLLLRRRQSYG